uniref:Elongation factor Ts, mitochondrial n=1 Tax=Clastoptera arizonana TaxID=38151 RepID=A0A1B6C6Y7_9HEMI
MNTQFIRYFHKSQCIWSNLNKSNLAKLRKKTGYTFANCKKALEQNDNDVVKAEKWLIDQAQALGWAKAAKLEGRSTAQGLIGIAFDKTSAAMVEVNCETDFVARNKVFQNLVDLVAKSCLQVSKKSVPSTGISKMHLDENYLRKLEASDKKILEDHIALVISSVGENLSLRRATCLSVGNTLKLAVYAHPNPPTDNKILLGKYGTLLIYNSQKSDSKTELIARQLCQHIVGMNPAIIGEYKMEEKIEKKPEDLLESKPEKVVNNEAKPNTEEEINEDLDEGAFKVIEEKEESALLQQEFLLEPDTKVGQLVLDKGIEVYDFVRFECGETMNEEFEKDIQAQQVGG